MTAFRLVPFLVAMTLPGLAAVGQPSGALVARLSAAHEATVEAELARPAWVKTASSADRPAATQVLMLVCGYANPASRWHRSLRVLSAIEATARHLQEVRPPGGLYDAGNLDSPPDSSFMVAALLKAQILLARDAAPESEGLRTMLAEIVRTTARAIAAGGVHTPNHRWDVAAMLAATHRLYPMPGLLERAEAWLAEGIDQDADGNFSERSPAYAGKVVAPAFIELAEELGRPDLLAAVRRHLELVAHLANPDGMIVTLASRRQDQRGTARVHVADYYWAARYLAVREGDSLAAGLARWIESEHFGRLLANPLDPNWPLAWLLLRPELAGPLPDGRLPDAYVRTWPATGLARVRDGDRVATINGSNDWHAGFGHGSGLATNPTFFAFQNGAAALESVRLTPSFFGTGFFYPGEFRQTEGGWRLFQRLAVPYYQPLEADRRRADGDYALTPDGRFFAKMAFDQRARDERVLETAVEVTREDDGFALEISVDGLPGVAVTLELAFRGDGVLAGVEPWARDPQGDQPSGATVLREGWGTYRVGDDTIVFGPGIFQSPPDRMWDGHIAWTGGRMTAEGQRVYLTGVTPFRHRLIVR